MKYFIQRLSEPSTYSGIAALLAASGFVIPPGYVQDAAIIGMAASGIVAVCLKEGWRKALADGDAATAAETAIVSTKGEKL